MRTLSATALAIDESASASRSWRGEGAGQSSPTAAQAASSIAPLPTFHGYDQVVYANEARRAGRINAASVSDEEVTALLRERQHLLDKKFAGSIDKREANRLEYVRWSLARIEDARTGGALDVLEELTSQYRQFHQDVQNLESQISRQMKGSRR